MIKSLGRSYAHAFWRYGLDEWVWILSSLCSFFSLVKLSGESFTEEDDLQTLIACPPCVVILGQSQYAKAKLVNEMFGEQIYPDIQEHDANHWRMVR